MINIICQLRVEKDIVKIEEIAPIC
jgi:hypothetical protein